MKVLIVDDELLVLKDLEQMLRAIVPSCETAAFTTAKDALDYLKLHRTSVAFLDIAMAEMNGIALAKGLKDLQPDLHIIFVTSYAKYALDAFTVHATGYLLKPVMEEDIKRELTFLYGNGIYEPPKKIVVQTFGGFDVFVDGEALVFKRSKAKELLAYLVDRRGNGITAGAACAILWEDCSNTRAQKSYYRNIVAELKRTLEAAGIGNILVKRINYLAIKPELLDCDSYQFMEGNPIAVNQYRGNYMPCYSWAEYAVWDFESSRGFV